jgi:hypothetical protein
MTDATHTPLTVASFREAHPDTQRSDAQISWYCDLDALILELYRLEIPVEHVIGALANITEDRWREAVSAELGVDIPAGTVIVFAGDDDDA